MQSREREEEAGAGACLQPSMNSVHATMEIDNLFADFIVFLALLHSAPCVSLFQLIIMEYHVAFIIKSMSERILLFQRDLDVGCMIVRSILHD